MELETTTLIQWKPMVEHKAASALSQFSARCYFEILCSQNKHIFLDMTADSAGRSMKFVGISAVFIE
jgi:hypothetical protein